MLFSAVLFVDAMASDRGHAVLFSANEAQGPREGYQVGLQPLYLVSC